MKKTKSNLRSPVSTLQSPRWLGILWVATLACAMAVSAFAAETITYSYDDAGRLIRAAYGGGANIVYAYDANGNLTQRTIIDAPVATGYVACVISPPAVTNDARWRLTTGTATNWQPSSASLAVDPGPYTVAFNEIPGWTTPGNQAIIVVADATTNLAVTYTEQPIAPTNVLVSGPATGEVGTPYTFTATVQPANTSPVIAYTWSPPPQSGQSTTQAIYQFETAGTNTVTVAAANSAGSTTGAATIVLSATQFFGSVTGMIEPAGAITDGAQWRLDEGAWQNNGITQAVATGSYTLEFKPLAGWQKPANQAVNIPDDTTHTVTGTYTYVMTVSPSSFEFLAAASTGAVNITIGTGGNIPWNATTAADWITLIGATNGTTSATVTFEIAENEDRMRTGTIQINDETITIRQRGITSALGWLLLFE